MGSLETTKSKMIPETVDILIIGAGPAGLALANWFVKSDIKVLIVDKKSGPTPRGQAEGLKSTTNEIFDTFGIGHHIRAEEWRLEEVAIWGPKNGGLGIEREVVLPDKVEELGKIRETMLQQARVEHHMLQNILNQTNITVRYSITPVAVDIDETDSARADYYPVKALLTEVEVANGSLNVDSASNGVNGSETPRDTMVRAKYIVGCDGARSWLRRQLNIAMEGDLTDSVFGVMDIVPKTNFPDIRRTCYLRALNGTIMIIPRSHKEVRLYIPVESGSALPDPKDLTFERIIDAARDIIRPYTLEVGSLSWWSAYRVGQRVSTRFSKHGERAFLAGDAVHTHSPKAGQGMNVSIQDAYNLGWKLRLILQGVVKGRERQQALLRTYESERRPVAEDLVAFDRGYLKLFAAQSAQFDTKLSQGMKFTTGLSIRYPPSCVVVRVPSRQTNGSANGHTSMAVATNGEQLGPSLLKADLVPGKRLLDFQVVYQADGTTTRIHDRMRATGAFRVLVFSGDVGKNASLRAKLDEMGRRLADVDPANGLGCLTTSDDKLSSSPSGSFPATVEALVIHCGDRAEVEFDSFPEVFRPWSEAEGYDYWRVFADTESVHEGHGRVYERLEIDEAVGCCVVVRPDGYVGAVLGMDDFEGVKAYFVGLGLLQVR